MAANKSLSTPQHKLLGDGYVRIGTKTSNTEGIAQICHEFYHKNVIVYQSQKSDPSIEEWTGINVGGHGGGGHGPFIKNNHALLTGLRIADLTCVHYT